MIDQKNHLLLLLVLFSVPAFSQIKVKSNIEAITVYKNGTKIMRTVSVKLPSGESTLQIWDIEYIHFINSLNLETETNGVEILEVLPNKVSYLEKPEQTAAFKELQLLQSQGQDSLNWLKEEIYVVEAAEKLLNENRKLGSANESLKVADISLLSEVYKEELLTIRRNLYRIKQQKKTLETRQNARQAQIRTLQNNKSERVNYLEVRLLSQRAISANFVFSFLSNKGSWEAVYDIRSSSVGAPLAVNYRAKVKNNTTKDWENVTLSLSTSRPSHDQTQPNFEPLFARFPRYQYDTVVTFDPEAYEEQVQVVKTMEGNYDKYTEVKRNPVGFEFQVNKKQSVAADGQARFVSVRKFEMPANYQYWTYPRKKESVFLLAKVTNYGQYDFVAGTANVFFDNAFIGRTQIRNRTVSDTLQLSLGIAQNVIVERQVQDFNASKIIGNSQKETFSYDIKLRNNQQENIEIQVIDQIPISTDKAIEIEVLKNDKGQVNKKNGRINWMISLPPNSSKDIEFSYRMKSPKDREVIKTVN